jgi:DNA ligase 1
VNFDPNRKLMEAAEVKDFSDLPESRYLVSIKCDGIRAYVAMSPEGGPTVYSRTHRPIPSQQVQKRFGKLELLGLEGELHIPSSNFSVTQSAVMAVDGVHPDLVFSPFPWVDVPVGLCHDVWPLVERDNPTMGLGVLWAEVLAQHPQAEGLMFRSCTTKNRSNSGTKEGRSTVKEGYLIKWKAKKSAEFRLVNMNPLFNKAGVLQDCLGSLVLETQYGKEFKVGTGFTLDQRVDIWYDLKTKDTLGQFPTDQLVEVEFMDYYPSGIPRQPVFKGFRDA